MNAPANPGIHRPFRKARARASHPASLSHGFSGCAALRHTLPRPRRSPRALPHERGARRSGTGYALSRRAMRLAIISDLHANVHALDAVLADIQSSGADQVLCLGDLVGYNSFPRETLARLRDYRVQSVHGNHDLMALNRLPDDGCGSVGRKAIRWTRRILTEEDWWYLAGLPAELRAQDAVLCVHSAPGDPLIRLERSDQFRAEVEGLMETDPGVRVCFTGHTHRQHIVVVTPDGEIQRSGVDAELPRDAICFVNPGTVGQPRDHDTRAAYALFDCDAWRVTFRRVFYDREPLLRQNRKVGLVAPSKLQRMATRVLGYPRP